MHDKNWTSIDTRLAMSSSLRPITRNKSWAFESFRVFYHVIRCQYPVSDGKGRWRRGRLLVTHDYVGPGNCWFLACLIAWLLICPNINHLSTNQKSVLKSKNQSWIFNCMDSDSVVILSDATSYGYSPWLASRRARGARQDQQPHPLTELFRYTRSPYSFRHCDKSNLSFDVSALRNMPSPYGWRDDKIQRPSSYPILRVGVKGQRFMPTYEPLFLFFSSNSIIYCFTIALVCWTKSIIEMRGRSYGIEK